MTSTLDAAKEMLASDIFPVPITPGTKRPPMRAWENLRLTVDKLHEPEFFGDRNGIGILLGIKPRPIADVDFDCAEARTVAPWIPLPKTDRIFGRPSNPHSHHLYELDGEFESEPFKDPLRKGKDEHPVMIELRGRGGQTVVPPSIHAPSGEQIDWERKGNYGKSTLAELRRGVAKIASVALLVRYWPRGHETRHALAGMFARAGWAEEETAEFVCAVVRAAQPDNREARADVRNSYARLQRGDEVAGRPKLEESFRENGKIIVGKVAEWLGIERDEFPVTEGENADRFAAQHAQDVRYCSEQEVWYAWNGKKWERNAIGEVMRRARATAETILSDARKTRANDKKGEEKKKIRTAWALRADSRRGLDAMVAIARYDSRIEVRHFDEAFDREPMLLNCQNGIVELTTGEVGPHRREAMMTKIAPVACDPARGIMKFLAYVEKTFGGSGEMIAFMQRFGGYCLTGSTGEQAFYIYYGESATSKSTYVKLTQRLMGEYAVQIPGKVLLEKPAHAKDYDTALLAGVRLATTVETGADKKLDEEAIKAITGQDILRGERKYENSFDFRSQAKLILATNYRPNVRESDDAIWRRIKPIPFLVKVPDEERVDSFEEKLIEAEGPGHLGVVRRRGRRVEEVRPGLSRRNHRSGRGLPEGTGRGSGIHRRVLRSGRERAHD
jgi:P4 family phage/plasmid primase-like protien